MNNETTTDYILRAEQSAAALKTAGEEVSDALLIAMIIKGLPHTFSTFSALTSQKTDEPSVSEFKVALRSYEETMKARGGRNDGRRRPSVVHGSSEREFTEPTYDV